MKFCAILLLLALSACVVSGDGLIQTSISLVCDSVLPLLTSALDVLFGFLNSFIGDTLNILSNLVYMPEINNNLNNTFISAMSLMNIRKSVVDTICGPNGILAKLAALACGDIPLCCELSLRASGFSDSDYSENTCSSVKVKGVSAYDDTKWMRGINTVVVNPNTCTALSHNQFDTSGSPGEAQRLVDYLYGLAAGTMVVGVSCDDAQLNLYPALPGLKALGVDVDNLELRDKLIFIISKGNVSETIFQKKSAGGTALVWTPAIRSGPYC